MRVRAILPLLLLAACTEEGMTRTFSMSRNSTPETMASTQMPLSAPPSLAIRPTRPGIIAPSRNEPSSGEQAVSSVGQSALVEAAGPAAESNIRSVINENSGLVYPGPAFVDQMMAWQPPPGYVPIITSGGGKSWLGRMF